jgi:hypothetical protein
MFLQVVKPFERIFHILWIKKNDLDEVKEVMF